MPLPCRGLFPVRQLKLGTGKLLLSQDVAAKAAGPLAYRQQHFRTLTLGTAPLPKARPSRAREKQVQKLPEPNFQFSPSDLPPIRKRDQLNARRGTNSKSWLSVTAESRRHEQNPCLPSSLQPPAAGGAGGKLCISGGATRQEQAPRAPTEPHEQALRAPTAPGAQQCSAGGRRTEGTKGNRLRADLAPSKSCFAGKVGSANPGTSEGCSPTPVRSLGGREQRIRRTAGGSITPQAVISYPILKMPIYNKRPFSTSDKKPFH